MPFLRPALVAALLTIAACAPAQPPAATLAPTATSQTNTSPTTAFTAATVTPAPAAVSADAVSAADDMAAERPAWQNIALTDARTGESFTFADLAGKTVYVEPMATWCTNCRAQQRIVVDVYNQLDPANYVFLSLSVGENIGDGQLAEYAQREGFPWTFAIATPEMLTALVERFGRTLSNPPSTPHFILLPDGRTTELATGQHSADALVSELTTAHES